MYIILFLVFFQGTQSLLPQVKIVETDGTVYNNAFDCDEAMKLKQGYDATRTDPVVNFAWRWGVCIKTDVIPPVAPETLPAIPPTI